MRTHLVRDAFSNARLGRVCSNSYGRFGSDFVMKSAVLGSRELFDLYMCFDVTFGTLCTVLSRCQIPKGSSVEFRAAADSLL